MKDSQYVFLVGCPRSGSSLTVEILRRHSKISVSPELKFFFRTYSKWRRFSPLHDAENQLNITENIFRKLEKFNQLEKIKDERDEKLDKHQGEEILRDEFQQIWTGEETPSFRDLVKHLFKVTSDKISSTFLIKTPHNLFMIKAILDVLPEAKFINLTRDGRNVVASLLKGNRTWLSNISKAASLWSTSIMTARYWNNQLDSDRFHRIYFEDMINSPRQTVSRLCGILGLQFQEELLNDIHQVDSSFSAADGFDEATLHRYKENLNARELLVSEQIMGPELRKEGYSLKGVGELSWLWKQYFNCYKYWFLGKENLKHWIRNQGLFGHVHWIFRNT